MSKMGKKVGMVPAPPMTPSTRSPEIRPAPGEEWPAVARRPDHPVGQERCSGPPRE